MGGLSWLVNPTGCTAARASARGQARGDGFRRARCESQRPAAQDVPELPPRWPSPAETGTAACTSFGSAAPHVRRPVGSVRLQAGERLLEKDFHLSDKTHLQAYCHGSASRVKSVRIPDIPHGIVPGAGHLVLPVPGRSAPTHGIPLQGQHPGLERPRPPLGRPPTPKPSPPRPPLRTAANRTLIGKPPPHGRLTPPGILGSPGETALEFPADANVDFR